VLNFYSSTRVNRPPEVRDRATAGLKSNRFKASIIKKWLCAVLCFVSVFSASWAAVPQAVHADSKDYLLDKVITWADGSKEHVQIDSDGFFILNGVKRRLVGFCDPSHYAVGDYWDAANITILHAELDYLQSVGVRLLHMEMGIAFDGDPTHYDDLLQLYYDHKMLVIPLFTVRGKWDNWDNLTTLNWVINAGKTVTDYLTEWVNHVKAFSNVVAIVLEDELDMLGEYTYTAIRAGDYMNLLHTTARALTSLPLLTKFVRYNYNAFALSAQNVLIPYSAIACIDLYGESEYEFTDQNNLCSAGYSTKSKPSQMWITETNYDYYGLDATGMTKAMVDGMLAANASVVMLFAMYGTTGYPAARFFDEEGVPIANCETLMANMATWQAAISQPATIPIVATTGARNITLTSAKINSNPISTSKVQSASKPVPIAQEIPRLQASLSSPPVVATAAVPIATALSTPAKGTTSNKILSAIVQALGTALQP
jgi:hypothetical protein